MLEVAEIFASLQGEGPFMGQPAKFLRLSGCLEPLCPWCDTPEGLRPGDRMGLDRLFSELAPTPGQLVVITGGEPFRQWQSGLDKLEERLVAHGCRVQYETSGKAGIPAVQGYVVCSPKFLQGQWRIDRECLVRCDAFKFVAGDDLAIIREFIAQYAIEKKKVWIMPQGATREEQLRRAERIWRFCSNHGYNFAPRLHILTFDQQQGI